MAYFLKVLILLHVLRTGLGQIDDDFSSLANNDTEVEVLKEEVIFEDDEIRQTQIKLKSSSSLESLLLKAIRISGFEICSSNLVRSVMLGTWRVGSPGPDELRDNLELRRTCYNALLKTVPPLPTTRPPFSLLRGLMPISQEQPDRLINISAPEDLTFTLFRPVEVIQPHHRMARINPSPIQIEVPQPDSIPDPEVLQKMNDIIKDRSAECKPRKIPVEIPTEGNITYLPACALVERCGGCCKHESLHCVPTLDGVTIMKKKVVAIDSKGSLLKVKQVNIEKHNKCKCQCKVQAKDCNPLQTYDAKNCRCLCKQNLVKPAAGTNPATCKSPLYWDERNCRCRCPPQSITDCSTGSYFSSEKCKCVTANEIIKDESKRKNKNV